MDDVIKFGQNKDGRFNGGKPEVIPLTQSRVKGCFKQIRDGFKTSARAVLTKDQYQALIDATYGLCPGCDCHYSTFKRKFCVDHDHETGIIRGLLCTRCNLLLGYALDNPQTLRNLAMYLEKTC